jgi:hypothetical protein
MISLLTEPGFWVALILIGAIANKAVGAAWTRRDFARLNELAGAELSKLEAATDDASRKASMKELSAPLHAVTSPLAGLVLLIASPAMAAYATVVILRATFSADPRATIERGLVVRETSEIDRVASRIVFNRTPFSALWIRAWLAVPFVLGWMLLRTRVAVGKLFVARGLFDLIYRSGHHA